MRHAAVSVIFLGYLLSFLLYFVNYETNRETFFFFGKKLFFVAMAGHVLFLLTGPASPLAWTAFFIVFISFWFEWKNHVRFLLLFSLPVSILFLLLAVFFSRGASPNEAVFFSTPWLWLHLSFILLGFAGLLVSASSALMYLLQSSQLKSKHLGRAFLELPPLETLDRLHFHSLSAGVVLFSLGILSGLFWAQNLEELGEVWKDPRVVLSFFACVLYWFVLGLRFSALGRGQKIAAGTVLIGILLVTAWMSSYYAPGVFHKGF